MDSKKLLYLFFFILGSGLFMSCGSDEADCANAASYYNEVLSELNEFNAAIITFSTDPSESNCNALKDAGNDYIDALDPWGVCLEGQDYDDWDAAKAEAQQAIDDITC